MTDLISQVLEFCRVCDVAMGLKTIILSRMLKKSASFVLGSSKSSTGTQPPHHSAARTDMVLLIRRTVRSGGYASGFDSPGLGG
jgi:hypothetical protein